MLNLLDFALFCLLKYFVTLQYKVKGTRAHALLGLTSIDVSFELQRYDVGASTTYRRGSNHIRT